MNHLTVLESDLGFEYAFTVCFTFISINTYVPGLCMCRCFSLCHHFPLTLLLINRKYYIFLRTISIQYWGSEMTSGRATPTPQLESPLTFFPVCLKSNISQVKSKVNCCFAFLPFAAWLCLCVFVVFYLRSYQHAVLPKKNSCYVIFVLIFFIHI